MEKNEEHYVKNMSGKFAREEMKSDGGVREGRASDDYSCRFYF
jgi:hypothetical protein